MFHFQYGTESELRLGVADPALAGYELFHFMSTFYKSGPGLSYSIAPARTIFFVQQARIEYRITGLYERRTPRRVNIMPVFAFDNTRIMQKALITIGIVLLFAGLLWPWINKLGLFRLPGDFVIQRGSFRFYFPVTSAIIISVAVSLLLWLFRR